MKSARSRFNHSGPDLKRQTRSDYVTAARARNAIRQRFDRDDFVLSTFYKRPHSILTVVTTDDTPLQVILPRPRLCSPINRVNHLMSHESVLKRRHRVSIFQPLTRPSVPRFPHVVTRTIALIHLDLALLLTVQCHLQRGSRHLNMSALSFQHQRPLCPGDFAIKAGSCTRRFWCVDDRDDAVALYQTSLDG